MKQGIAEERRVYDKLKNKNEILFVDDSPTVLAMAKKMLGKEYIVRTASNGDEAWSTVQENSAISVVFTDLHMPMTNGLELLIKIRNSDDPRIAKMPVLIITGKSDTTAARRVVFEMGATDFIGKPFDALGLLTRARAHIGQGYKRRDSDEALGGNLDMLVSPSGFHSIGCQALEFALEKKIEFSVVYIEVKNYIDLKQEFGDKIVKQIVISIASRITRLIREEDVATRLGENRYAIISHTDSLHAKLAIERLFNDLNKLDFELNDRMIDVILACGYSIVDCNDKKASFSGICKQAEISLQNAKVTDKNYTISRYSESAAADVQKSSQRAKTSDIDLWTYYKYIADGEYQLVPKAHADRVVESMEKYIDYVKSGK